MRCEDCGFEFSEGTACPRCGYTGDVDLVACAGITSAPVVNPLEQPFFMKLQSLKGNADAQRACWQELDQQARVGNLDARHIFARVTLSKKEFDKAHRMLANLADAGHTLSQLDLAALYETGTGVEKDPYDAIHLYRLAAQKGNPIALFKLAQQHAGQGLLKADPTLANDIMEKLVVTYPQMFKKQPAPAPQPQPAPQPAPAAQPTPEVQPKPSVHPSQTAPAAPQKRATKFILLGGLAILVLYIIISRLVG